MASGNSKSLDDNTDVRKMGYLIKLKTNKKKYFVLRESSGLGPARLEYYDSEKKFRSKQLKRSIDLRSCFNINRKTDGTALGSSAQQHLQQLQQQQQMPANASARAKQFAIALFTKDDCFTIGCESEEEQLDWLTNMTELRNATLDPETVLKTPQFEHIWSVIVKQKELGNEKKISPGEYRFCLTNDSVSLIRINEDHGVTVPIDYVKRVGCSNHFVMIEFGRAAVTGPGSLWLQVEDIVIAHNIHAAMLGSMKVTHPDQFRMRSVSNAPALTSKERDRQRRATGAAAAAGRGPSFLSGSGRPQRSKTIHVTQPQLNSASSTLARSDARNARSLTADRRSLHDPTFDQIDQAGLGAAVGGVRTITPEAPILEESSYMAMSQHDPVSDLSVNSDSRSIRRVSPSHIDSVSANRQSDAEFSLTNLSPITIPTPQPPSDYLDMSPQGSATTTMSHSPVASLRVDNKQIEGVYLNMSPSATQDVGSASIAASVGSVDYMSMSPVSLLDLPSQQATPRVTTTSADEYMNLSPASAGKALDENTASGGERMIKSSDRNCRDSARLSKSVDSSSGASSNAAMTTIKSSDNVLSTGTPDGDTVRARSGSDSYMMMAPAGGSTTEAGGTRSAGVGGGRCVVDERGQDGVDEYISMTAPASEGYLSMSIRRVNHDDVLGQGSSSSVSSGVSSVGSSVPEQSTDVSFRSLSRLPEMSSSGCDGYIEMVSPHEEEPPLLPYERPRLATVHCYVREENDEIPYRTFSVGSKPFKPVRNLNTSHYVDMTGRKVLLNKAGKPIAVAVNKEVYRGNEKSSSAPHLTEELLTNGVARGLTHRPPQHPTLVSKSSGGDNADDRLMMLDFDRGSSTSGSNKDEDIEAMPRLRTSSGGSRDLRTKAFSFSGAKEAITSLFKRSSAAGHYASNRLSATSAITSGKASSGKTGSSRVRTESFGLSVAQPPRPRASTEGNPAQLREAGGLDAWVANREVTRKAGEVKESAAKPSEGYMDMNRAQDSGYMPMSPATAVAGGLSSSEAGRTVVSTDEGQRSSHALSHGANRNSVIPDLPYMDLSISSSGAEDNAVGKPIPEGAKSQNDLYMDMQPSQRKQEPSSAPAGYMDMKPNHASTEQSVKAATGTVDGLGHLSSVRNTGQVLSAGSKNVSAVLPGPASLSSGTIAVSPSGNAAYMSMVPGSISSNIGKGGTESAATSASRELETVQAYVNLDYSAESTTADNSISPSSLTAGAICEQRAGGGSGIQARSNEDYITRSRLTYASLDLEPGQPVRPSPSGARSGAEHAYAEIDFNATKK